MDIKSLKGKIELKFGFSTIKNSLQKNNELYVEIINSKLYDACLYAGKELEYDLVSMFVNDERNLSGSFSLYCVFADRKNDLFLIFKTLLDPEHPEFKSISGEIYAAASYEREINDMYGIKVLGHPELKRLVFHGNWPLDTYPLRKDFDGKTRPAFEKIPTAFTKVGGKGVYEIPVGPVHAGIIEPGHFRFSVAGEPIINLEAQLYYVHKGIEKLSEGMSIEKCFYLSERISGDESFSNSLAFCHAIERAAGIKVPERAEYTRVIFAETERFISHLGDLMGICQDVAYGFAKYQFNMIRDLAFQLADTLCGSRYLRSVNKPGGIRKELIKGKEKQILEKIDKLEKELRDTIIIIKSNSLFIDRVENTGVLQNKIAKDLNAVGPAGRASGICNDVRRDFPYAAYDKLQFTVPEHANGDVNCRMNVKIEEALEAIMLIRSAVNTMPEGQIEEHIGAIEPYTCALGYTESPKGENMHWIMIGENNTIFRYKIRTPSFCNWPALCYAVRGNIVPDFPLINKSFNLSYAGNDL